MCCAAITQYSQLMCMKRIAVPLNERLGSGMAAVAGAGKFVVAIHSHSMPVYMAFSICFSIACPAAAAATFRSILSDCRIAYTVLYNRSESEKRTPRRHRNDDDDDRRTAITLPGHGITFAFRSVFGHVIRQTGKPIPHALESIFVHISLVSPQSTAF